jgi:hypothetical protein
MVKNISRQDGMGPAKVNEISQSEHQLRTTYDWEKVELLETWLSTKCGKGGEAKGTHGWPSVTLIKYWP